MFFDKILSDHLKELRCPTQSLQHALLCSAKSLYRSPTGRYLSLIEIFWLDLTFKQKSSQIYRFAGTPVLLLSTLVYSEVALECL